MKEVYCRGLLVLILFFSWIGPAIADTSPNYWASRVTNTNTTSATINWRGESNGSGSIDLAPSSYYNQHQSFEKTIASQTPFVLDTDNTDYLPLHTRTKPAFYADFTAAPISGPVPLSVAFTDSSEGDPEFWNYDFGDGLTSTAKNPIHLYRTPGTYAVTLTVIQIEGGRLERNTTVKPDLITVKGSPGPVLVANFNATPLSGKPPLGVTFIDNSTGKPDYWNYNFGDGTTSSAKNPTHTYLLPGTYTVTQTVMKVENGRLVRNTTTRQDLLQVSTPAVGWAIGEDKGGTPAIVQTTDGGLTWQVQGDLSAWPDLDGNDISAVDDQTAWAALGSGNMSEARGAILHTTDGGTTWVMQPIPDGLFGGIKGVKGLSRSEAWAASLGGTVLHTVDGGNTWDVVGHPLENQAQVNRIDATGSGNVWIAALQIPGTYPYIVHTSDYGLTWEEDHLHGADDSPGLLAVSAYRPSIIWCAVKPGEWSSPPYLYRTVDAGTKWLMINAGDSMGDWDDICTASQETVWGVITTGSGGSINRVHVEDDGTNETETFLPADTAYSYEGVTCLNERIAWAVGRQWLVSEPDLPLGVIVFTVDGGDHWVQGIGPPDIKYWKVSFVGAMR